MDGNSMIGKTRGDYTVQKDVGKGTFGQVYQVTRTDQIKCTCVLPGEKENNF
jgi:serine/threonine protein kinase